MPGTVPLIGEKFPEMTVETTHGVKKLPDDYKGNGWCYSATQQTLHQYVQLNS